MIATTPMFYQFDDYVLDTTVFELRFRGALRPLQPKPLDLLAYLVRHRARVVLKSELLAHLWPGVVVTENALAQAVACVREALREAPSPTIASVRGRGYRFVLPVVERGGSGDADGATVFDAHEPAPLEAIVAQRALAGAAVVRVAARGHQPLGTFRALMLAYAEAHPDARVRGESLAQCLAAASDEHTLADLIAEVVSCAGGEESPASFVIENLERADLASLLLFALLASSRPDGMGLLATCAWGDLDADSAAARVLVPLAPSCPLVARTERARSDAVPRRGATHRGTRAIVPAPASAK